MPYRQPETPPTDRARSAIAAAVEESRQLRLDEEKRRRQRGARIAIGVGAVATLTGAGLVAAGVSLVWLGALAAIPAATYLAMRLGSDLEPHGDQPVNRAGPTV